MGTMALARTFTATLLLLALPAASNAEGRVALVIGNGDYSHASALTNPPNDAADVAAALDRLGFAVTRLDHAGKAEMERTLQDFSEAAFRSEVAVVFYAGHGIEVDGQNYLVPVDARLATDRAVRFETVPLDLVMQAAEPASGFLLVVLDACRDNPFAASMRRTGATRSVGTRGLALVDPSGDTLVAYAAKAGTAAQDGSGRNSPYTAALLDHLEEPGLEVSKMFRKVRDAVVEETGNVQVPFTYGSRSSDDVYLAGRPGPGSPDPVGDGATVGDEGAVIQVPGEAKEAFDTAESIKTIAAYKAVIDHFPGFYATLARQRIEELEAHAIAVQEKLVPPAEEPVQDAKAEAEWHAVLRLGHKGVVTGVAFSPDSRVIASGSSDGYVRLWDSTSGQLFREFSNAPEISTLAFSPDRGMIASGSSDGTVRLWVSEPWRNIRVLEGIADGINSVALSPNGGRFAIGANDSSVHILDVDYEFEYRQLDGHKGRIFSVAYSPDGAMIASGSSDGSIRLWDAASSRELDRLDGHSDWVRSVAFSPDGRMIASGSDDQTVRLWEVASGRELQVLEGHSGWVRGVAFSPDGGTVASGSDDHTVRLWEVETGHELQVLKGHEGLIVSVAFSPDGSLIASGSYDSSARVWEVASGG